MRQLGRKLTYLWATLNGSLLFYTRLPLPPSWPAEFSKIALVIPWLGIFLGTLLSGLDWMLLRLGMPIPLCSALVILTGIWLTGGLHLDGAMDTGDGLAVQDDHQRLTVMADSRTGAFGAMVAIAILLLKIISLASMGHNRWFALLAAAAWGRWGQQWTIGRYPYLKPQGKGAFHKQAIPSSWYTVPALIGLSGLTGMMVMFSWITWAYGLIAIITGISTSFLLSAWLNRRLGGQTGDTYGAVVEWVEVAVLVGLATIY
ncbi:MAG: adenosylcobinamide-GDP ribazoletransferase [Cyanobacteria bacterium J06642_11]